jgi:glycerol-3-phosphate dehydrogenase
MGADTAGLAATQAWVRADQKAAMANQSVDVLVIGGGASGAGVFLDALSRGLSAVLIEKQDFMAGTSSRSTKLVHGGVRYLEQAVQQLDPGKYQLVKEALSERKRMLAMAPHLAWPINLITPVKSLIGLPYFRVGLGVYDFLSGSEKIGPSRMENKKALHEICPDLDLKPLAGGVSYFDGQFDDARFGVAMLRTALEMGGHALNYAAITGLIHEDGLVVGAHCSDLMADDAEAGDAAFSIHAKAVVNCTGPWSDSLRTMADPECKPVMSVSSGVHLVIDRDLLPTGRGILIPETEDGRVLFLLPWLGKTLIGTTDDPAQLSMTPTVSDDEIDYILRTANSWLSRPILRSEVSASWSGLRPLVADTDSETTSQLSREHVVINNKGLISLTGGKWTTWRRMGQDCIDFVLKNSTLTAKPCGTPGMFLAGAQGDAAAARAALAHLPADIQAHLWQAYGDRADQVLACGSAERLVAGEVYIEAELHWIVQQEGACTVEDVLNRRLRVGMLDERVAAQMAPRVAELLAQAQTAVPA